MECFKSRNATTSTLIEFNRVKLIGCAATTPAAPPVAALSLRSFRNQSKIAWKIRQKFTRVLALFNFQRAQFDSIPTLSLIGINY